MAFAVPESKRSIKQNAFTFSLPGSKTEYSLPLLKYLTIGQIEQLQSKAEPGIVDILALVDNPKAQAAVRTLDAEQIAALFDAWQKASGISAGE